MKTKHLLSLLLAGLCAGTLSAQNYPWYTQLQI